MGGKSKVGLYQEIMECAPDAMLIVDPDGIIILVNRRAEILFEYCRDDLLGHAVEILIPKDRRAAHRHQRSHHPESRYLAMGTREGRTALRHDGSMFPADISLGPLHRDGVTHTVVTVRDLTANQEGEEGLLRLLAQVRELESEVALLKSGAKVCLGCGVP